MNLKESIQKILSDKKVKSDGLHVKFIAMHVLNLNNTLFSEGNDICFAIFKRKVNRILANDVKHKRKNVFIRIKNPKTNKFRKGYYKLKPSHISKTNPTRQ